MQGILVRSDNGGIDGNIEIALSFEVPAPVYHSCATAENGAEAAKSATKPTNILRIIRFLNATPAHTYSAVALATDTPSRQTGRPGQWVVDRRKLSAS